MVGIAIPWYRSFQLGEDCSFIREDKITDGCPHLPVDHLVPGCEPVTMSGAEVATQIVQSPLGPVGCHDGILGTECWGSMGVGVQIS